jgi:hypothetical protein
MAPSSSGHWAGSVSACWNTLNKKLEGGLGTWNPAKSVEKDRLTAKREPIADADLPDWYACIQTMRNPIQRDGLLLALFTGLADAVLAVPALDRRRSCWMTPRRGSASAAGGGRRLRPGARGRQRRRPRTHWPPPRRRSRRWRS